MSGDVSSKVHVWWVVIAIRGRNGIYPVLSVARILSAAAGFRMTSDGPV